VTSQICRATRPIGVSFVSDRTARRLPPFSQVLEEHGTALLRFCPAQASSGQKVMQISEAAARRNVFEGLSRLRGDLAPTALARNLAQPLNEETTP
jgi:hypothetical protein